MMQPAIQRHLAPRDLERGLPRLPNAGPRNRRDDDMWDPRANDAREAVERDKR